MKRVFLFCLLASVFVLGMSAQTTGAQIKFEKKTHDFGTFSENDGLQTVVFPFTNEGDAPLVIHQAIASCGCTVASFTKTPIKPGESGEVKVSYDGKGKWPGEFSKTITIKTNGTPEAVKLYIKGNMTVDK